MHSFQQTVATIALVLGSLSVSIGASPRVGAGEAGAIEAQIIAAEGVRSVKRLQHSMAQYLESGSWADLGKLFTATAQGNFGSQTMQGAEALQQYFMQQAGRKQVGLARGQINTPLIMQPIVTLGDDGRSAKAIWHEFSMLGQYGKQAIWKGGVYENEYVAEQGVWKINRVRYFPQYTGDYDAWGHKAPARWNIPYHFEGRHVGVSVPAAALKSLATGASFGQLVARLQRLEDETQVQNLQHSMGYYLDRKLWDDVVDLFAADGSLQIGPKRVAHGATAIRTELEAAYGAAGLHEGELFDQLQFATVVNVAADGRSAKARSLSLSMLGRNGEYARWESGIAEGAYVRENNVWKLRSWRYVPRMVTDYDLGWARDAQLPSGKLDARINFPHPVPGTRVKLSGVDNAADEQSLQQRVHAAIAIDAIENLNSSYGYYIDESDWDSMADTFGSTGSKEITGAGVYITPDRIRAVLKRRGPSGGRTATFFTIHQLVQPVIHVAADGLTARARLRLFQCGGAADGSSGSWIGGIYENTALYENGEWKFGDQDLHHLFNASYRNGWARFGDGAAKMPAVAGREVAGGGIQQGLGGASRPAAFLTELPPDRAIRSRQYAFPVITEPAFHYRNPVSGRMPAELLP